MISRDDSNILKAIGILMVILCHIVGAFGIRYATPLGGIGVSIFLFVSGYGLSESYKKNNLDKFFIKRFSKVLIPYIIIVLVDSILQKNDILYFLKEIILINTPNFMWFIQFIVIIYMCFYIINLIFKTNKYKYITWITIGIIIFMFGDELWAEQSFIFFIGILYSDNKLEIETFSKKNKIIMSIIFISLGIFALVIKQMSIIRNSSDIVYYTVELVLKNSSAMGIVLFIINIRVISRKLRIILQKVGLISYELYLVHAVTFFILKDNVTLITLIIFIIITIIGSINLNLIIRFINNIQSKVFNLEV